MLAEGKAPDAVCPRCEGAGAFDDDAETYFGFVAQHGAGAIRRRCARDPPRLERADEPAVGDVVEKSVEGRVTRLKVGSKLTALLRWSRIIDGLEGLVVFDLSNVPRSRPTARRASSRRCARRRRRGDPHRGLSSAARRAHGGPRGLELARIESAVVEGCRASCSATRTVLVEVDRDALLRGGQDPGATCKRCNTPLAFDGSCLLLYLLGAHAAQAPPARCRLPCLPASSVQQPAAASQAQPHKRGRRHVAAARRAGGNAAFLALLGGVALAAVGFAAWRGGVGQRCGACGLGMPSPLQQRPRPRRRPPSASAAPAAPGGARGRGARAGAARERPRARRAGRPWTTSRPRGWSGRSSSRARACSSSWPRRGPGRPASRARSRRRAQRRARAPRRPASPPSFAGSPAAELLVGQPPADAGPAQRAEIVERIAGRFLAQVGAFATPRARRRRRAAGMRDGVLAFAAVQAVPAELRRGRGSSTARRRPRSRGSPWRASSCSSR